MTEAKFIHMNGTLVPYADAKVHIQSPGMKFGIGVFEGVRGYWNAKREQMFVFRLQEHLDRLQFSMRVMRMDHDLTNDRLTEATLEVIRANEFRADIHLRPFAWVDGQGDMLATGPVAWSIAAVARPRSKLTEGVSCAVSSWRRISDTAMPPRVKASGNYINSRLGAQQSQLDGYDTVLMLTEQGRVAESYGSCFFMIRNGRPVTPNVTSSILESITRATLIDLLQEMTGREVEQRDIDRTELYDAEEAFLCGSSYEVQPILSIDRLDVGTGQVGALTRRLQQRYFDLVYGETNEHSDWLTPVYGAR
ncbi:MAG TPA: branched-chain amino acid transaminase [Acetobacteraceae bacterium]|jgi:branched-chain amino acid aminotransferase|nr:branched-chain amino acid transaminase [Acetobacteraceae bacterium]